MLPEGNCSVDAAISTVSNDLLYEDVIASRVLYKIVTHIVNKALDQDPTVLGDDVLTVLLPCYDAF